MVWTKNYFVEIQERNARFLQSYMQKKNDGPANTRIAIVGLGPKGAYALERLLSQWKGKNDPQTLEISCFNQDINFACGPNYHPGQPDHRLLNYPVGKVNFWINEPEQAVQERPNLVQFIQQQAKDPTAEVHPNHLCSRAAVGIYLQYCFIALLKTLPAHIKVQLCPEGVKEISLAGTQVNLQTDESTYRNFNELMICTGHSYAFHREQTEGLATFAERHGLHYLARPLGLSCEMTWRDKTVLLRGMGLTFVDVVLDLTEGQGGTFEPLANGTYQYISSGEEPLHIIPFSRTGQCVHYRNFDDEEDIRPRFFTESSFKHVENISWRKHVLPVLRMEYRYQYALRCLHATGLHTLPGELLDLEVLEVMASKNIENFEPLDFERFLSIAEEEYSTNGWAALCFDPGLDLVNIDPMCKAVQSMGGVWRAVYPLFNRLYHFGGLDGAGQEEFDKKYFGALNRISYGIPLHNARKLQALIKADILNFDWAARAALRCNSKSGVFELHRPGQAVQYIQADVLVEARIPKSGSFGTQPKPLQSLSQLTKVTMMKNGNYQPGCLQMDQEGRLHGAENITLYGSPTEGWTLDNESLSREINNFASEWSRRISTQYANITTCA